MLLYAPCSVDKYLLSPYDPKVVFTPHLQRFAERATTFMAHRTEAGSSGVAYASILSATQANRHGVFRHPSALPDDLHLITEAYAERGYETFFWNGHVMASARLNYAQGVETGNRFRPGLKATDPRFVRLLERLSSEPDYRAFVMTNFSVTHGPYRSENVEAFVKRYPGEAVDVPATEFGRLAALYRKNALALAYNNEATLRRLGLDQRRDELAAVVELLYRSNLSLLDDMFGAVLDAIDEAGLRSESLIVFTADHGEVMYRDDLVFPWTHSSSLAPEVLEVPLLIATPDGERSARRYEGVSRSIDVFPTMTELSGWRVDDSRGLAGLSLAPATRGRSPENGHRLAFSHTAVPPYEVVEQMRRRKAAGVWATRARLFPTPDADSAWVAVRNGPLVFKWRRLDGSHWRFQAFDLGQDPFETTDVFDPNDTGHQQMARRLEIYKASLVRSYDALRNAGVPGPSQEESVRLLRELGYIQ